MAHEVKEFYSNDIVYRFDKHKRIVFGIVVDSFEASTDSDDNHALQKGQIRVWWFNDKETVWRQNKVHLKCRRIVPGDIVRRLENNKETQRGYCKDSKQIATVQIVGTNRVIERVAAERLPSLSTYDYNVAVCFGDKYGRIQSCDQKITMQSKCGSVVEVFSSTDFGSSIKDYWQQKRNRSYIEGYYYSGQEITCIPNKLEQANWINRSKTMLRSMQTRQRFTIQKVEPNIEMAWYDSMSRPNILDVNPEDIKKLKVVQPVEDSILELARRHLLKLNSSDLIIKKQDWIYRQSAIHQPGIHKVLHIVNRKRGLKLRRPSLLSICVNVPEQEDEDWISIDGEDEELSDNGSTSSTASANQSMSHLAPSKGKELGSGHTLAVEILCVDAKATVVWQDGTEEKDIPSTELYFSISLDDHEFFPGEWVVRDNETCEKQYGTVQHVNHIERTATVKWFTNTNGDNKLAHVNTNEMSVYDLRKHSKFAFRPGSAVKRIPVEQNKLGCVLDSCPEGYVIVKWTDGTQENCSPHNLELIPETIDYDYSLDDNEGSQVSWETESIESIAGDVTDEVFLQNMADRLDFIRGRVSYLKGVLKQRNVESFSLLKEFLVIYDNSSYLDRLLDTSFFSLKSRHFQLLLSKIKERAKQHGVELRGRMFGTNENLSTVSTSRSKNPEKENINKVLKLEHKINNSSQGEGLGKETGELSVPQSPDCDMVSSPSENICIELLSMLKVRMDLAYAEIISRIGSPQVLSVMTKASEINVTSVNCTPLPSIPETPDDVSFAIEPLQLRALLNMETEVYKCIDEAHFTHRFYSNKFEPTDRQRFFKAIQKEYKLLKSSLPPGVWIRSYANRMDLLSVMIRGPANTPYEDGLFLFDLQLGQDYPRSPPLCHYISYSTERLNPNLYVEGKVCVSLLGTWMGRGTEVWGPKSSLLQLIVSIQGLILVAEPYFNEAGYEKQMDSQQGYENSRTYNELVILKLVQSMTEMLLSPPEVFKSEILAHFAESGVKMGERLGKYCCDTDPLKPDFSLLPVSKGLKLSLSSSLNTFQETLKKVMKNESQKCDKNASAVCDVKV